MTPEFHVIIPKTDLRHFTKAVMAVTSLPEMMLFSSSLPKGLQFDNIVHGYTLNNPTLPLAGKGEGMPDLISTCQTSPKYHWMPTDQYTASINEALLQVELNGDILEQAVNKYLASNRHWWQRFGRKFETAPMIPPLRGLTDEELAMIASQPPLPH